MWVAPFVHKSQTLLRLKGPSTLKQISWISASTNGIQLFIKRNGFILCFFYPASMPNIKDSLFHLTPPCDLSFIQTKRHDVHTCLFIFVLISQSVLVQTSSTFDESERHLLPRLNLGARSLLFQPFQIVSPPCSKSSFALWSFPSE